MRAAPMSPVGVATPRALQRRGAPSPFADKAGEDRTPQDLIGPDVRGESAESAHSYYSVSRYRCTSF